MIEYKVIPLAKKIKLVEELANEFAQEGWRLVCSCGKNNRVLIFKRKVKKRIEEEEDE